MKTWSEMTYDEQRNALGLANVKYAVLGVRCTIAAGQMMDAFRRLNAAFKRIPLQSDYALAGSKEAK